MAISTPTSECIDLQIKIGNYTILHMKELLFLALIICGAFAWSQTHAQNTLPDAWAASEFYKFGNINIPATSNGPSGIK